MRMKQWQIQDIGQMAEENPMNGDLRHWQNYSHLKGFIIPFYGILGCCSDILCLLCSKTRQASTSLYCGFHHFRPYFLKLDKWIKAVCCRLCIYFLVEFIAERKLMSYVIGVILCSLIHRSALLLLPFYWIFDKSIYFKTKVTICLQ